MNNILTQYTRVPNNLFALLSRYRVVIPGIQRHYVQGADNPKAKSIRENFINAIFNTIETSGTLCLHFVYGPINTEGEDSFVPVDGQQRLTTLWLVARYAAERLEGSARKDILKLLDRFSYADRILATRFCRALSSVDSRWDENNDPLKEITSKSWFEDYWIEDETVSSMLRVLSTIHEVWQNRTLTCEQVLESLAERISFELQIDSFGDDIYMKMNARGIQLTQWENFKCKFANNLGKEDDKSVWERNIERLSNSYFCCFKDRNELPDNALFALFARIFVYLGKQGNCNESISKLAAFTTENWDNIELPFVPYSDFMPMLSEEFCSGYNLKEITDTILLMLEQVIHNGGKKVPYFGNKYLFDTFFHPQNINELEFSLCCFEYFIKYKNVNDAEFIQATRLIWNILENTEKGDIPYNRVSIVKQFIKLNNPTLYAPDAKNINSDAKQQKQQVDEEIKKSEKMHHPNQECPEDWIESELGCWNGWRNAIELAESEAFFKGSISFLIYNAEGHPTWEKFATKLINCKKIFCDNGLKEGKEQLTNQVLISHCDDWNKIRNLPVFSKKKDSWKRILTNKGLIYAINKMLIEPSEPVIPKDTIIKNLLSEEIWDKLIQIKWKEDKGEYVVDYYYNNGPCLWLKRYPTWTLKLERGNKEEILDGFNNDYKKLIQFDLKEEDRFLCLNGENHYYTIPIFFEFSYKEKKYRFVWQMWGYIDMYEGNKKLFDLYFAKYNKGFNILPDAKLDVDGLIEQLKSIIDSYEDFKLQINND